jgi:hypothetical protein
MIEKGQSSSLPLYLTRKSIHKPNDGYWKVGNWPDTLSFPVQRIAIVASGLVTAYTRSAWPDLLVGLGIALMNADAAREIYQLARKEHRTTFP